MHAPEQRIAADETKRLRFALSRARGLRRGPLFRTESAERCSEAATKGSVVQELSRNWLKPVGGMSAATMVATLAAMTSQCGGPLDPLWPPRFESWVFPLLVLRACGIIVHSPRFCSLTQSVEQWPEVTRAALTVSLEKRTRGLLCLTFSAMSNRKDLARDVR